jgi:DNA-binding transcriptional LysR family regulator
MLPDLESLRCFVAAARHASFRKAARETALSPAAFSDRIKRLEESLQAALFVRRPREVKLTAAGDRLLPQARRVLEEAARCREVLSEPATHQYQLTVGTRFELGLSWLTPALRKLAGGCPGRTLHLYFGDSSDLLDRARSGALDAAVTSARFAVTGFRYQVLHREDYALVAAPRLLARRPLDRPAHSAAHVLLGTHREGFHFQRIEYLGTIAAVRARVLEGAGVAVLPRYFVAGDWARSRVRYVLPELRLQEDAFRLVWRADHPYPARLTRLAEDLRELPLQ